MICRGCHQIFEDDEVPTYEDDFGYETGVGWKGFKQTFLDNCQCGGKIVEAGQCKECGKWFAEKELSEQGLCTDCLKIYEKEACHDG